MQILDLEELEPGRSDVFGGKACGLARLLRAGARVPPGFAVSATISAPKDWTEAERAELLGRGRRLLSRGALAVRSSAVGEDSATRSFAGLFETVLGVKEPESLLAATGHCIASGSSDRVRAYAPADAPMPVGVVVQSELVPLASGVCFTVDPAGRDRAVVVEAVAGKGEALVSGRAQPEAWRLYRSGLGGWESRVVRSDATPVLRDGQAGSLAEAAVALAERFGHPLDLEWAIDETGSLWWLQARPVTSAAPPRDLDIERYFPGVDDGPVTVWSNWNVREVVPDVVLPLNWSLWKEAVIPSVVETVFGVRRSSRLFRHAVPIDLVHGRIYWNMNALLAVPIYGRLLPVGIDRIDARSGAMLRELRREKVLRRRRLPGSALPRSFGVLLAAAKSTGSFLMGLAPRRALRQLVECGRDIARRPELASLDSEALLEETRLLDSPVCDRFRRGQQASATGFLVYVAGEHAFRRYPDAHRLLTAGIPGNPTTMISVGIDELAEAARGIEDLFRGQLPGPELLRRLQDEPRAQAFRARLEAFLESFGHRCPGEFDIGVARWSEDPTMILRLVRSRLTDPGERVAERLARLWRERRLAVDAAVASAPFWRRGLLRLLARLVAVYMPLREAPKHYAMIALARMRMAALELGRRLALGGSIERPKDVFFLEFGEVRALVRGEAMTSSASALVEERRQRWARRRGESAPDFVRSDGVPVVEPALEPDVEGALSGTPASSGSAVGTARILTEPDPMALAPGDVLVAAFADPGWTPLFPRAGAVVTEVGGAMCHAAVVARELGIPAVFGVAGATRLLRDGQRVRVDGDRGKVVFVGESLSI